MCLSCFLFSIFLWQDGIPVRSREWLRCLCPLPGNHFHGHFIHIRQGKERNPHELAAFDLTVIDFCPMTMWVLYVGCRKLLLYRFFRPLKTAATSTTDLFFFYPVALISVSSISSLGPRHIPPPCQLDLIFVALCWSDHPRNFCLSAHTCVRRSQMWTEVIYSVM